jgi:hypothetical protein
MSRTYRRHVPPEKLKEWRTNPASQVGSKVALDAMQRTGAGTHGKPRKAVRRAEKVALKAGRFD